MALDRDRPIIDAHHHLWNPQSNDPDVGYVWLKDIGAPKPFGDPTPIQRDYLLDEFLSETNRKIVSSVHVQADGAIPDPVAETRFIQALGDQSGFPIAIVGFVDLSKDDAESVILEHKHSAGFVGTRQILSRLDARPDLSFSGQHFLDNPKWRSNYELLAEHQLSFDLQLYPEQMHSAAEFLSVHQKTPVIIDHAGSPYNSNADGFKLWKEGMALLASLPNTSVKIGGLGMFDLHLSGKRDAAPYIDFMLEIFGIDRVLFGSNFPVDKLMSTYEEAIENITRCLPSGEVGKESFDQIFHDNTKRIYRL